MRCLYCGVSLLNPRYRHYPIRRLEREIKYLACDLGIRHIAIYDDAFLFNPARTVEILSRIARLGLNLRFHGASGLSCRGITPEVAQAMKQAGFFTIRLGLETVDTTMQKALGGKVSTDDFLEAFSNLNQAGFSPADIGVFILVGLPGQTRKDVEQSLEFVLDLGAVPHLAEYSPVPGSPHFSTAQKASNYDLSEPLYHNPTLMPTSHPSLDIASIVDLKQKLNFRIRQRIG